MAHNKLTSEQEVVIHHPAGNHARVLAVAGSGKTEALAERIKYLVLERNVSPTLIRVLMFNRLARQQFQERLGKLDLPAELQPEVDTFHSFCYKFIGAMVTRGLLPGTSEMWLEDKEELIWLTVKRAITNLEQRKAIPPSMVEADDVREAMGLWKGSLIPPARAGYRRNPWIPLVYAEFEDLRWKRNALTYDDFVPLTVDVLEAETGIAHEWCNRVDHLIVDEYQDVNYGQQRLIELLAGQRADVMVVGDDDQTIYEWRGARPHYIMREFRTVFANKPHVDYHLSRSFRFGPVIAQAAANVIAFNTNRVEKSLIAHIAARPAHVHLVEDLPEQMTDANKQLAEEIVALIKGKGVHPKKIRVLARMFAQLTGLQTEFLARHIPFRVVGQAPFFQRREIRVLLDYIRLAHALDHRVTPEGEAQVLSVANTPSRKLGRDTLSRAMDVAHSQGWTVRQGLQALVQAFDTPLSSNQRERLSGLIELLDRIRERCQRESALLAGDLLTWLAESLNYNAHFADYYGKGETSYERQQAVEQFLLFARYSRRRPLDFITYVEGLDTTRGVPEDEQIVMTTIFRTKGLEFDYVFVPQVEEGYLPCLYATDQCVFDTKGVVKEPEPSEVIENERRLFYVAVTRAREAVYIGTSKPDGQGAQLSSAAHPPSRFIDEMQLPATLAMMGPLQQVAAGNTGATGELLAAVSRHGGIRRLVKSLTSGYLSDMGQHSLIGEVAKRAALCPESAFAYRRAYQPPYVPPRQETAPRRLHSAWDDVAF